ncbi:MAG: HPF/RaiA family ribosome-associated protein [Oligoflexia bacterium]|nr:HPF/RaiA family ribosome-associated protein [Oligoflexia bacterium]
MQVPLQIVFHNLDSSRTIAARIRERVAGLEEFFGRIISCRVAVEVPHKHRRRGNLYHVRIDLRVPGKELVVRRGPGLHGAHKDLLVTIHDAFDEAKRELEDYTRQRRYDVKTLTEPARGEIVRLVRDDGGFGFIRTEDGREIYFHSHSVLNEKYDQIQVGCEVRFVEESGEEGPQASTVEVVQPHAQQRALRRAAS